MNTVTEGTVRHRFYAPLRIALERATNGRHCPEYSDESFLICGVGRVIEQVQSGREWVQRVQAHLLRRLSVATFFQALRSTRRQSLSEEVAKDIAEQVDKECGATWDPLAEHRELLGYHLYASDGHYHEAAAHTSKIGGTKYAMASLYTVNLRTHSLSLLDVMRPKLKKEHDVSVLKRLSVAQLRMGAPTGAKVIHVYDPAAIDYRQWFKWKAKGIYIISREKANSAAETIAVNLVDKTDPRNTGVLSDELVGVFSGVMIRRIRYQDPATGTLFSYMTNEMKLPPGLIAFLYKLRWDIEKIFDEKKNKLQEKKAWGSTDTARCQQAHFVCMAHNLMILLERQLEQDEDIRDTKLEIKRQKRVDLIEEQIRASGRTPNPMVLKCTRITQRSLQFIRWLRCAIGTLTPWRNGVEALRPLMANYLA